MIYKRILNKMSGKMLILFLILGLSFHTVCAQNPVLLECMNINKAYLSSSYLSFDIKYKYAFEATPATIEDSSMGEFKLHGYKYWGLLDSVEFMQNDSFLVALYHPEKVLSLARPAYHYSFNLPLAQWDSLFLKTDRFTYGVGVESGWKKITVDYNAGLPYKKFEMWYDSSTYRISRIRYVISEYATHENFYELPDPGDYGIVDILFSGYQTGLFDDSVFDASHYFVKSGSSYTPAVSYTNYEVFIASSGL
jgi:hypothetical protein